MFRPLRIVAGIVPILLSDTMTYSTGIPLSDFYDIENSFAESKEVVPQRTTSGGEKTEDSILDTKCKIGCKDCLNGIHTFRDNFVRANTIRLYNFTHNEDGRIDYTFVTCFILVVAGVIVAYLIFTQVIH